MINKYVNVCGIINIYIFHKNKKNNREFCNRSSSKSSDKRSIYSVTCIGSFITSYCFKKLTVEIVMIHFSFRVVKELINLFNFLFKNTSK